MSELRLSGREPSSLYLGEEEVLFVYAGEEKLWDYRYSAGRAHVQMTRFISQGGMFVPGVGSGVRAPLLRAVAIVRTPGVGSGIRAIPIAARSYIRSPGIGGGLTAPSAAVQSRIRVPGVGSGVRGVPFNSNSYLRTPGVGGGVRANRIASTAYVRIPGLGAQVIAPRSAYVAATRVPGVGGGLRASVVASNARMRPPSVQILTSTIVAPRMGNTATIRVPGIGASPTAVKLQATGRMRVPTVSTDVAVPRLLSTSRIRPPLVSSTATYIYRTEYDDLAGWTQGGSPNAWTFSNGKLITSPNYNNSYISRPLPTTMSSVTAEALATSVPDASYAGVGVVLFTSSALTTDSMFHLYARPSQWTLRNDGADAESPAATITVPISTKIVVTPGWVKYYVNGFPVVSKPLSRPVYGVGIHQNAAMTNEVDWTEVRNNDPIQVVGTAVTESAASTFTANVPAQTQVGDLQLLYVHKSGTTSTIPTPTGWTLVWNTAFGTSRIACFWRLVAPGAVAPSITGSTFLNLAYVLSIRNASSVDVSSQGVSTATTAGNNTATTPSVTTTSANQLVIRQAYINGDPAASSGFTWPATESVVLSHLTSNGSNRYEFVTEPAANIGATGAVSAVANSGSGARNWSTVTVK